MIAAHRHADRRGVGLLGGLQVMDMRRTRRGVGGGGVEVQSRGRGKVSDWVLLVTDYANQVGPHHRGHTYEGDRGLPPGQYGTQESLLPAALELKPTHVSKAIVIIQQRRSD